MTVLVLMLLQQQPPPVSYAEQPVTHAELSAIEARAVNRQTAAETNMQRLDERQESLERELAEMRGKAEVWGIILGALSAGSVGFHFVSKKGSTPEASK